MRTNPWTRSMGDEKLTVTIPDVPVDTVRHWANGNTNNRPLATAARAALAEWEAQKPRYVVVSNRSTGGGWYVMQEQTNRAVGYFASCVPNAEAEARTLAARLNGGTE